MSQSRTIDDVGSRWLRPKHLEFMPRSTSRLSADQIVWFFQVGSPIRSASCRATSGTPSGIHVALSSQLGNPIKIMSYLETAKSLGRSVGPRVDVVISRPVWFFRRLLARLPKSDQQWFGLDLRFLLLENVRKPVADN